MISRDDIDAFADDLDAADEIVKRAERGVDPLRLFSVSEIMPFIRAYVLMRNAAQDAASFMADLKAREMQGMSTHED